MAMIRDADGRDRMMRQLGHDRIAAGAMFVQAFGVNRG